MIIIIIVIIPDHGPASCTFHGLPSLLHSHSLMNYSHSGDFENVREPTANYHAVFDYPLTETPVGSLESLYQNLSIA